LNKKLKQLWAHPGEVHDTVTGYDFEVDAPLTRGRAIRAKCVECCGCDKTGPSKCRNVDCPLWPFRRGYLSRG